MRVSLSTVTQELSRRLLDQRQYDSRRPIIFIGHDFGVTIIEKTLLECQEAGVSSQALCRATAAIIFLASPGPDLITASELSYFTLDHRRRLGCDDTGRLPYVEIRNDDFLSTHVKSFKNFADKLSGDRCAMTLKSFVSNGKFSLNTDYVYTKIISTVCNIREVYPFLIAASDGEHEVVKAYLESGGRHPDLRNAADQSALHLAVQRNQMQVIRVLVEGFDADVTAADHKGQTPLHLAMMHPSKNYELIELLFERGADVNLRNKADKSSSDLAKEFRIDPSALDTCILFQGPSEDIAAAGIQPPSPPPSKIAGQACCNFRATIAEFHILQEQERFIRAQPTVGEILYERRPDEILSAMRRSDMTTSPRCQWFHLPANNVAWVEGLFSQLNLVVEELVDEQHEGQKPWSHFMRPQSKSLKAQRYYKDQNDKWQGKEVAGNSYVLFMPFMNYERACDSIQVQKAIAERVDSERRHTPEPILGIKVAKTMRQLPRLRIPTETGRLAPLAEERSPSNSSQIDVSSAPGSLHSQTKSQSLLQSQNGKAVSNADPDNSYRLQSEKSLIHGYLYDTRPAKNLKRDNSFLGPLHVRRTLDQSHYFMLENTSERDRDQVVLRGARQRKEEQEKMADDAPAKDYAAMVAARETEEHPLVMVDQLWLWVVGTTVITSFPQNWSRHNDVLDRLLRHLRAEKKRTPIHSPQDLVNIIITFTIGVFNLSRTTLGLELHDYFETAVGSVADNEIRLFRQFEENIAIDPTVLGVKSHGTVEKMLDAIYEIREEIKLMRETKDIRDELRIILRILNDQAMVLTDMATIIESTGEARGLRSPLSRRGTLSRGFQKAVRAFVPPEPHHQVVTTSTDGDVRAPTRADVLTVGEKDQHVFVTANIRDFNRMLSHANATYEALNHLLDLKQKYANATEARVARRGVEESAKQGRTIVLFTIATIIFGSLSFVSTFLALDVSAFPPGKSSNGSNGSNGTSWKLGRIVGYVAGISFGLAIPFVGAAFAINPTLQFWDRKRRRREEAEENEALRESLFYGLSFASSEEFFYKR